MNAAQATPKQTQFLNSLLKERVPNKAISLEMTRYISGEALTTREASAVITELLGFPRKPSAVPTPADRIAEEQSWFEGVEKSYYAVPTSILAHRGVDLRGDLAFFRVYEFKGRMYIRLLRGAPGDFATYRLTRDQMRETLALLARNHMTYALAFGEHFSRCGRCSAPLTDKRSRETHLGPECRRVWGVS